MNWVSGLKETEELEIHDAIFECRYLLIYVNNCIQLHLALPNLTKFNPTQLKNNKNQNEF